jgi:hypothetical protein
VLVCQLKALLHFPGGQILACLCVLHHVLADYSQYFPAASYNALDLLDKLLTFDPGARCTATNFDRGLTAVSAQFGRISGRVGHLQKRGARRRSAVAGLTSQRAR